MFQTETFLIEAAPTSPSRKDLASAIKQTINPWLKENADNIQDPQIVIAADLSQQFSKAIVTVIYKAPPKRGRE